MSTEGYIIYGWEETTRKIIDKQWLDENNINIYCLEINNNIPTRIVYGYICEFNNGVVNLDEQLKNKVKDAFTKIYSNLNIKLEYFIGLNTTSNYYNYFYTFNPEQYLNYNTESSTESSTDINDSDNSINYFEDSD